MLIGILGGGLSGISLQHFLKQDSEVLEKEDRPGGLCRTFQKDGFTYDIGGHILFSKDKFINDFVKTVLAPNINSCIRNNKILFRGRYVKYPFENGFGILDKQDIYECLMGYLKNKYSKPTNFREWIYYTFGKGIAEKYIISYNRKIWKMPLEKMGLDWVERIPRPPFEDIVKTAIGIEMEGYLHQLHFNYPKSGGIEGFVRAISKGNSHITTGYKVRKIEKKRRGWLISDGCKDRHYDKLVLTIPIQEALKCISSVPAKVCVAASRLRHNSVRVVLIGINNRSLLDKSAVYIPEKSITPHRICYMGYFSRNMVPKGCSSLVAEITTREGHALYKVSDAELTQIVVNDLCRIGVINRRDIVTTDVKNIEYGYVIPDLTSRKNVLIIKDFFRSRGIGLLGRFAEFQYLNMDEVINRSRKMAENLEGLPNAGKYFPRKNGMAVK